MGDGMGGVVWEGWYGRDGMGGVVWEMVWEGDSGREIIVLPEQLRRRQPQSDAIRCNQMQSEGTTHLREHHVAEVDEGGAAVEAAVEGHVPWL